MTVGTCNAEVVCKKPELKPLRCVCGSLINATGEPVPRATVTVVDGQTEIAVTQSSADGKFVFSDLKAGSYSLHAQAAGYEIFQFSIVVDKPGKKCKRSLLILLNVGGLETCTSIRLVKR
jgi:hypothetical protein